MSLLKYLLYPPAEVQASNPLIFFLHGVGERGDDLELVKKYGLPHYLETGEVALPAYVAAPQCPADQRWESVLDGLDALLESLLQTYPLDVRRVYLTGFSMGGYGVWHWGLRHPDKFAALMPVGGNGRPERMPPEADLSRLGNMPVWMIHGAQDMVVPVEFTDRLLAKLAALGANFGYTRYPDTDHGQTSDRAFADMTLYRWLLAQTLGEVQS